MAILKDHSTIWDITYVIVSKEDGEYPKGFYEYNYKCRYDKLQRSKPFSSCVNYFYDLFHYYKIRL